MRKLRSVVFLAACASLMAEEVYRKPPQPILDVLDAAPSPRVSLSPDRKTMLLAQGRRYPPIADLARPMLKLAGHRVDPKNNGPHRPIYAVSLMLQPLPAANQSVLPPAIRVEIPHGSRVSAPDWSPDSRHFAFLRYLEDNVELWVGNTANGQVRLLVRDVNAAFGDPMVWTPGSKSLLVEQVPSRRGAPPQPPEAPAGPNVQESFGSTAPVRTYQDLLGSPHDENLFEYYGTSQLREVPIDGSAPRDIGRPAIFAEFSPSPDGKHLFVRRVIRPFSRLHPSSFFPSEAEVWDRTGTLVKKIASLPLAEVPIDGVPKGPRLFNWKPTDPSTLVWAEALDEGNPKNKVPFRDRVVTWKPDSEPVEMVKTEERLSSLGWLERGDAALIADYNRDRRWVRTFLFRNGEPLRPIFSRNIRDRYKDPGTPITRTQPSGHRAVWQFGEFIFLSGVGATPSGDRPFLDKFSLTTLKAERLFRSAEKGYEFAAALVSDDGSRFITSYESPNEPPNFFLRATQGNRRLALTAFPDPVPMLRGITKELVTYKRPDGVQLSFRLYLPPGYKKGTRLPTVIWAYPREYSDAETAGQVSGSSQRFTMPLGASHLLFTLAGYAVLDDAAMPVIGDPETVNNTYIEQVVASARAAVDRATEMGVTDPNRVGVGGHSYGAFMAANLLAHSDIFRAGIARSGAHNRTLTPFGFQAEPRTLWEAPEIYLRMSPILAADKIKEPLLLIHGEQDNNAGTFPIQSERMYHAVRGNGGHVRLVMLPNESHTYVSYESVAHTLAEMISWFNRYVKDSAPRKTD